jgi:hypothetical protein
MVLLPSLAVVRGLIRRALGLGLEVRVVLGVKEDRSSICQ